MKVYKVKIYFQLFSYVLYDYHPIDKNYFFDPLRIHLHIYIIPKN